MQVVAKTSFAMAAFFSSTDNYTQDHASIISKSLDTKHDISN